MKERPASFSGEFFEHLFHAAELANLTPAQRRQYDFDMTTAIDEKARYSCALERGWEKGMEKGLKEGMEKGMEKGLEKGRTEAFLSIAVKMKEIGTPLETILLVTGLTEEQVRAL